MTAMKINDYQINSTSPVKADVQTRYKEDPEKLMEVCKQFESVFLNMMLKQMRATVVEGGLTEKSHGRDIFESMQDEGLAQEMAKGNGVGLAQFLYKQMQRQIVIKDSEEVIMNNE